MTGQQLKNSILQMAVQGKLVPQDPNDEPASVLLERIRAEKEQLIKEGKIKKERNSSIIFRGADNLPYEKVGKNEPVCIADEVPFEIPDSWEWVRLGAIVNLQSGQDMTSDKYNNSGKGIPYITGASNIKNGNVLINRWTECGRTFAYCGDILLTCKGTVGAMAILQEPQVHIARQIMAIRPIGELYVPYIQLVLDTLVENLKSVAKSMIPGIARTDVLQSFFPLPPINEQKQIALKISKISPYLKQYISADAKLLSLNYAFPEALKKSILQDAVQGKLVPQDPADEPASILLERIRAEKQRLIAEGKIQKDKHESVIFRRDNSHYEKHGSEEVCIDDKLPFEIPRNWEWCYLGNVAFVTKLAGFEYTKYIAPNLTDAGIPLFKGKNVQNGKLILNFEGYIPEHLSNELLRSQITKKCLLTPYVGTIGNIAIFDGSFKAHLGSNVGKIELINPVGLTYLSEEYVLNYLKSPAGYQQLTKHKKATAQESISIDAIRNVIIPIPPINEQNRIINMLAELEEKVQTL